MLPSNMFDSAKAYFVNSRQDVVTVGTLFFLLLGKFEAQYNRNYLDIAFSQAVHGVLCPGLQRLFAMQEEIYRLAGREISFNADEAYYYFMPAKHQSIDHLTL